MMLSPSRRGGPIGKKNGAPVRKKGWFVMLLRSRDGRVRIFKRGLNQPFHASFGVVCDGWGVSSGGRAPRPKSWSRRGGPQRLKNRAPVRKKGWFVMLLRSRGGRAKRFKYKKLRSVEICAHFVMSQLFFEHQIYIF